MPVTSDNESIIKQSLEYTFKRRELRILKSVLTLLNLRRWVGTKHKLPITLGHVHITWGIKARSDDTRRKNFLITVITPLYPINITSLPLFSEHNFHFKPLQDLL